MSRAPDQPYYVSHGWFITSASQAAHPAAVAAVHEHELLRAFGLCIAACRAAAAIAVQVPDADAAILAAAGQHPCTRAKHVGSDVMPFRGNAASLFYSNSSTAFPRHNQIRTSFW